MRIIGDMCIYKSQDLSKPRHEGPKTPKNNLFSSLNECLPGPTQVFYSALTF